MNRKLYLYEYKLKFSGRTKFGKSREFITKA